MAPCGAMAMRGACMLQSIQSKALNHLAFFPDVCARAYVVCATAYRMYARPHTGISARRAGKPRGLDTISTGNPGCPRPGSTYELHAGRWESRPFFTAFRRCPARSTRSNDAGTEVFVVPDALPVTRTGGVRAAFLRAVRPVRLSPAEAFPARPASRATSGSAGTPPATTAASASA